MKFLTSSSSTTSSTITTATTASTSFDNNVHNSRSTPAGCITGVFRRLLCINSLPTHPSDHFKDTDQDSLSLELDKLQCTNPTKAENRVEASATPSIVARLMGLESLPQIDFSAKEKSSNSIARSLSMNSADLMKEHLPIQGRHRRVKSFRETAPIFLELEDEEFFILSFENGDEIRKLEVKSRKSEMGSKQMIKQSSKVENFKSKNSTTRRESVYENNKENQDPIGVLDEKEEKPMNSRKVAQRVNGDVKLKGSTNIPKNSCQNSIMGKKVEILTNFINHKDEIEVRRSRRRMNRKGNCLPVKKIDTDQSDSENSSPSSVLNITRFPCDTEIKPSEEISRLTNSKSRRTLTEELENFRKLNHQCIDKSWTSNASCRSRTCIERKTVELKKNDHRRRHSNYVETWGEICKMAERDGSQTKWILLNKEIQKYEDYKEISGEFEMQILEELLGELVDQLVGNYHQNF